MSSSKKASRNTAAPVPAKKKRSNDATLLNGEDMEFVERSKRHRHPIWKWLGGEYPSGGIHVKVLSYGYHYQAYSLRTSNPAYLSIHLAYPSNYWAQLPTPGISNQPPGITIKTPGIPTKPPSISVKGTAYTRFKTDKALN
uniref:Uncharacterized protein n=1 Tax=Ditylenchus dipsaci TaxID=166011 RepID=A0A915DVZ9_9BILA